MPVQKRSVSPFGIAAEPEADIFSPLDRAIAEAFGPPPDQPVRKFSSSAHIPALPARIRKAADAFANDAPWLDEFCTYLVRMRPEFDEKGVSGDMWTAMLYVFERKTELFLFDHVDEGEERKNQVLFSRERDTLVGRFFAGWTEREPGLFSEFIRDWTESENPDRVLHFLDFCAGSGNPTFEHYLLFTHPALDRLVTNKTYIRSLLGKVQPLLAKLRGSSQWEENVRSSLRV